MARPTFVDIAATDVDLNSPGKEDAVFTALRNNINALRIQIIATDIAEATTGSTSYVTLATIRIFLPNVNDYTGIVRRIVADLDVKISGGGTATYQLRDLASLDVSNEETSVAAAYETLSPALILPVDPVWLSGDGVTRDIEVRAKKTGGTTVFMKSDERASWYQEF